MDLTDISQITNSFQDIRLVSLSKLSIAVEFPDRDNAGPYVVVQEGYDPQDIAATPGEFLLSRVGTWMLSSWFFSLPVEQRRAEFFFSRAAEVMRLLENLPSKPVIARPGQAAPGATPAEDDELLQALKACHPE